MGFEVTDSNFTKLGTAISANAGEVIANDVLLREVSVGLSSISRG